MPAETLRLVGLAPLGDPLEVELRGGRLSIGREDALAIATTPADGAS